MSLIDIRRKLCSVGLASGLTTMRFINRTDTPHLRFKFKMAQAYNVNALSSVHGADLILTRSI